MAQVYFIIGILPFHLHFLHTKKIAKNTPSQCLLDKNVPIESH